MLDGEIVEIGPTEAVLRLPRHPYTKRLIAAVPSGEPGRRIPRGTPDVSEPTSPIRPIGWARPSVPFVEIETGHFVRMPQALAVEGPSTSHVRMTAFTSPL
jgi:ABC-type oligopeptide transport system ATPase subunit